MGRPKGVKETKPRNVSDEVRKNRSENARSLTAPTLKEGTNAKFIGLSLAIATMPPIDLNDDMQVQQRIIDYFKLYENVDVKPTVNGLAMALGMDRVRLWEIKVGKKPAIAGVNLSPTSTNAVKRAYQILEELWENYMQNGAINPVSGIFLGKNNFGYKDQQETVVTTDKLVEQKDRATLEQKYNDTIVEE